MKKNLWMLGMAVAALTSCTQSEVLEVPEGKKIRFEEFVEKNSRAAADEEVENDLVTSGLNKYFVYTYYTTKVSGQSPNYVGDFSDTNKKTVFEGMIMEKGTDGAWIYGKEDSWVSNALYRFAAYSNGNTALDDVAYDPAADMLSIENYSVIDATGIKGGEKPLDLVAAIPGDRYSTNQAEVSITLRHLLSKVTFHFTNNSNKANIRFRDIQINGISNQGDCVCYFPGTTMSDGKVAGTFPKNVFWTSEGSNVNFKYKDVDIVKGTNGTAAPESVTLFLIPQPNKDIEVTMTMEEYMDNSAGQEVIYNTENLKFNLKTNTVFSQTPGDLVENMWAPGYHYRYLITKGTGFNNIRFSASVSEWNKDVNGDGTKDNDDINLSN